jgi:hypothetical protein
MPIRDWLSSATLTLLLALLPLTANAWNPAGHRLSAFIAWQQLDDNTRRQIAQVLAQHPDYERWIARRKSFAPGSPTSPNSSNSPELAAFLEAATWPDDIKGDKRFYDADDDTPTSLLPGFPDMARHREWHYVDRPLDAAPKILRSNGTPGTLDRQLPTLIGILANSRADDRQRAYALPWLIHLVGDAHQPLHAASRYDAAGHSDEGGNLLTIAHPFHPRRSSMSLHAYWDDLAGPPWLRGEALARTAQAIVTAYPPPASASGPERWLSESWQLARTVAYPATSNAVPEISAAFHELAQSTAQRRIAEAGYRLAMLLKTLFGRPGR